MNKMYNTIIQALDELELHYDRDDEHCMADLKIMCETTPFHLRMVAMEDQEVLYCFSVFPIYVPEDKRPAMCELINAINYDKVIGLLTMDPKDGKLTSRVTCSLDNGAINTKIVTIALQQAICGLEDNYAAILKVLAA